MAAKFIIVLAIAVIYGVSAEFPDDPKPCKYGDKECIQKLLNYITSQKFAGDDKMGLLVLDPLNVTKLHISRGGDSPVNIDLVMTNGLGYGLKTAKCINVTGFTKDIATKHEIVAKAGRLQLMADYTIKGKILILPLTGSGKCNFTLIEPVFKLTWIGAPYEKEGEMYMKVDKYSVDIEPKGIIFNFDNLFNDKTLSDNTNKFLTENWAEIYPEVRGSIGHGYSLITRRIINSVFAKYPYNKYLTD